jgi:hypothetical protein
VACSPDDSPDDGVDIGRPASVASTVARFCCADKDEADDDASGLGGSTGVSAAAGAAARPRSPAAARTSTSSMPIMSSRSLRSSRPAISARRARRVSAAVERAETFEAATSLGAEASCGMTLTVTARGRRVGDCEPLDECDRGRCRLSASSADSATVPDRLLSEESTNARLGPALEAPGT